MQTVFNNTSSYRSNKSQTRRRSSNSSCGESQKKKLNNDVCVKINCSMQKNWGQQSQLTPEEEKSQDDILQIVYAAPADIITPPPSPKSIPSTVDTFGANDRILAAKKNGQLKFLLLEYKLLQKEGLLLNDQIYNLVFESYTNLRRDGTPLTPMIKIYDEMIQSQIQPSSSSYILLIRTLCKRDVEVQKVIAMLKRQTARSACTQANNNMADLEAEQNISKALSLFKAAVTENLVQFFDAELYNQILRVLSHYGNTTQSLFVYKQLELHSKPTPATFAALINLFGRVGNLGSATEYYEKYLEMKDSASYHDASYIYNALVDAHLKCHQLEGAIKIIKEDMVQHNVKMSTIPYNSIIRYFCLESRIEEAKELIETMRANCTCPQPDASSYGPVLSAYCQAGLYTEATEMYQALVETTDISKSYGNLANYALLCLKHDQQGKILQVMEDLRQASLEPDVALAEQIMIHFAKLGQMSESIHALQTVLSCMKPRSLAKGLVQIKSAAIEITKAANGCFHSTLQVARVMASHGLPVALAKILIENYEFDANHDVLVESDYAILFDASLAIASDASNSNRNKSSSLSPVHVFAFGLQSEMENKGFKVCASVRSRILSYFVRSGDRKSRKKWEALFDQEAIQSKPSVITADTTIMSESEEVSVAVMKSAISGQAEEACGILRIRIVDAGLIPSVEPIRDAIAFVGKQGNLDTALSMYHLSIQAFKSATDNLDPKHISRAIYMMTNAILIGYAQQGDMVQAKKYYEQIKLMGRYPDGNGYASLLLGSAKCATDEATDALTIYDEAKRRDVKPTTFFYNVVISKLAKARKLESAMKLFEEMQTLFHIVPNSITYGAIISACVRAGSEFLACKLFQQMLVSSSFQPRVGPFNNMIQFYVRQQPDRAQALSYFSEMRRRHVKPSTHTYKLLMEAYCLIAPYDMETAHRMLSDMEVCDHIRPQATHFATLIYSYGTLQYNVASAQNIFDSMRVEKDEVMYQAMLDTLVTNDCLEAAENLYSELQRAIGTSSSPYIENVFIRGYGQKGLLEKAKAMFDAMSDDKVITEQQKVITREPSTYEAMVRAYIENNKVDEAKMVFELMVEREFPKKVTAQVGELIAAA